MTWFNTLTVKAKLSLLVTMFTLGFIIFASVAFSTLETLRIKGPLYQRIVTGKDAIADVLPPPKYIIESYLVALQMGDPDNAGIFQALKKKSDDLRGDYDKSQARWSADETLDPEIKSLLVQDSHKYAIAFFDTRDNELIPAIARHDYKTADALLSGPLKRSYDAHRKVIDKIVSLSQTFDTNTEKEARDLVYTRRLFLLLMAVATIGLFGLGLGYGISRSIASSLTHTINALSVTSAEMAATIEQHERTAVVQAAAVHETTTTMDELDASFNQASEMVRVASDTAQQAANAASDGLETVRETLDGMQRLKTKVTAVSEQISNLSEQTAQIGNITRVVGDLANQTNMLALNAAVEAARAGEQGKGFGVVAAEIRKLADESRKSAQRINALVEDIAKATNATVMATEEGVKAVDADIRLAEQTARAFNGIVESSNSALEASHQTLLAVPQQIAAVRQVLTAMEDLNRGARETAAGLGQTRASIETLREAATTLKTMM